MDRIGKLAYKGRSLLLTMEWTIMKFLIGAIAVLAMGSGIMFWIFKGSGDSSAKGNDRPVPVEPSEDLDPELLISQQKGSQFGTDRLGAGKDVAPVPFDGKRAMTYLNAICGIGHRISGTKNMEKQQELIKKHFEDLGAKVAFQSFEAKQNSVKGKVPMTNIVVSFQPEKKRRVILCSHYDTRPIADQEPEKRNWQDPQKPFVSANDGGSGVAFLMEMAHHMKELKTNVGVDFVFFDGEEFIYRPEGANRDEYFIGSKHFAQTWRKAKERPDYSAAILLDMIAGKNFQIHLEGHSWRRAPELCRDIWGIAKEQQVRAFVPTIKHEVLDDHIELQKVYIPAIDLIDFDYAHWHRLTDTPDKCSGESMEQVAKVLSVWLQRTK